MSALGHNLPSEVHLRMTALRRNPTIAEHKEIDLIFQKRSLAASVQFRHLTVVKTSKQLFADINLFDIATSSVHLPHCESEIIWKMLFKFPGCTVQSTMNCPLRQYTKGGA